MRWTRAAPETKALSRTAKSCGSDAPRPASSLREEAQATVPTKPGHRGEREISRKTIARGMPGDFRCDRGDYARVLFSFAREAAAHQAPGIPCALCFRGERFMQNSGASRRGIAHLYLTGAGVGTCRSPDGIFRRLPSLPRKARKPLAKKKRQRSAILSIKGRAYIAGIYEHPTRHAPDKSTAQLHAEVAKGA